MHVFLLNATLECKKNQASGPNLAPKVGLGTHKGFQNQAPEPNEGVRARQVRPEKRPEHRWSRSWTHLRDLWDHGILSFLLRKWEVFPFCARVVPDALRAAARDVPGGPTTGLWTPAPLPYNLSNLLL